MSAELTILRLREQLRRIEAENKAEAERKAAEAEASMLRELIKNWGENPCA